MKRHLPILALVCALLTGCNPCAYKINPTICYTPTKEWLLERTTAFGELTEDEKETDWGKEVLIAGHFTPHFDLYRAITGYKRAQILMPQEPSERRWQVEYSIILSYYLGGKYVSVVREFEESTLSKVPESFPVFEDMLIILAESYRRTGNPYRAQILENLLQGSDEEKALNLKLYRAIKEADFCKIEEFGACSQNPTYHNDWTQCYFGEALSIRKAQTLNAILPGAGYYYTGQRRTAFTAFFLNAAFTAATYKFFKEGYTAAGIITASLEFGWYFGGINGAGLSAKLYNDRRYSYYAEDALCRNKLYPALMVEHAF